VAEKKDKAFIRHPDFRAFYAIGAVGTWTAHDFRLNFFSEKVKDQNGEALVNDVQIILPPKAVRELAVALTRNIKEFERTHGISLKGVDVAAASELQLDSGRTLSATSRGPEEILGPDFRKDLKKDLKQDLKKDLKQDLKKDLKQDLKKDLKQDLKKDLKQDLKQDLKKDIQTEIKGVIRDTREKEEQAAKARLPRRGRRRVKK